MTGGLGNPGEFPYTRGVYREMYGNSPGLPRPPVMIGKFYARAKRN